MATVAWLERDDRSDARRSLGWSKARQPRALEQGSTVPAGARLNGPWSMARQGWPAQCFTIAWMEQGSTTKSTGARLDSACRSRAQRTLEQGSTGMIEAVFDDRLDGARLDNKGHRSKARPCLPEQGSTAPGARLYRDDRSSALRSSSWSKVQSTKGTGARLDRACLSRAQRHLEQGTTGMTGAVLYDLLVGASFNN